MRVMRTAAVGLVSTLFIAAGFGFAVTSSLAATSDLPTTWTTTLDCAACHTAEAESLALDKTAAVSKEETGDSVQNLASVDAFAIQHVNSFAIACTDCHNDDKLEAAHKKMATAKKMPSRLRRTNADAALCLTCHKTEELAQATASSTVLSDENGTVVNPHDIPPIENHGEINCLSCHTAHSGKSVAKTAMGTCKSCHHEAVFECGTCHA